MFEDIKKEDEKMMSGGRSAQGAPGGAVEDMFDPVDPVPSGTALQSGRLKPVAPQKLQSQTPGSAGALPRLPQMDEWSRKKGGRGLRIILLVVVLLAIGAGGYYFFFLRSAQTTPPADTTPTPPSGNTNTQQTGNTQPGPVDIPTNALIDGDNDGLSDVEEQTLGTDPTSVDTDSDGLSDKDEVRVYKINPLLSDTDNDGLLDRDEIFVWRTNPQNPDTDGDSYPDGTEVQNGYDPNGPGKLAPTNTSP